MSSSAYSLRSHPYSMSHPFRSCVRVWGLGFGVWDLGCGVWGLVVVMWGLGSGVWGLGSGGWYLGSGGWNLRAPRKPRAQGPYGLP